MANLIGFHVNSCALARLQAVGLKDATFVVVSDSEESKQLAENMYTGRVYVSSSVPPCIPCTVNLVPIIPSCPLASPVGTRDPKGSMVFLQNNFRGPPLLEVRRT